MSEWIEWKGGKRPVSMLADIEVVFRSKGFDSPMRTDAPATLRWSHKKSQTGRLGAGDIIAYRIVEEEA